MKKTDKFATYRNSGQRSSANAVGFPHCIPAQNHHKKEKLMMSTKNSLIAFLFLASPVWSQQQVAATGLQTPHKLILTPTLARVSGPGTARKNQRRRSCPAAARLGRHRGRRNRAGDAGRQFGLV